MIALLTTVVATSFGQKKHYVLVHGAWHGAWCWDHVVPLIKKHSHNVIALDLPGHGKSMIDPSNVGFDDMVNSVTEAALSVSGRVILVGHSSGGVLIAQASERLGKEKVERLVFLDAFMPANGESVLSLAEKKGDILQSPTVNESMVISTDQKSATLKTENVANLFYHDCSEEDIKYAKENLCATPLAGLATPVQVSNSVYGAIPKIYILCTLAKDLGKKRISENVSCEKIINLESGHSPFFSMPEKLVEIFISL